MEGEWREGREYGKMEGERRQGKEDGKMEGGKEEGGWREAEGGGTRLLFDQIRIVDGTGGQTRRGACLETGEGKACLGESLG